VIASPILNGKLFWSSAQCPRANGFHALTLAATKARNLSYFNSVSRTAGRSA